MCGIAGVKRFGDELITPAQISTLLLECQSRGMGASGVAMQRRDGDIHVCKAPLPAWSFVRSNDYQDFLKRYLDSEIICAMVHARAPTKGTVHEPSNNHPLMAPNGDVCAIHNGVIYNDDHLFSIMKLDRATKDCQVDSDIIRAILEKEGLTPEGIRSLKRMSGSAAIAAFSRKEPGKLLLARSGSPIMLASTDELLVWASEKKFIHTAMRQFVRRFGIIQQANRSDMTFTTMNDDSAWILDGELHEDSKFPGEKTAVLFHEEFDTCANYTPPNYRVHENFANMRRKWWNEELPEATTCPNRECGIALTIPAAQRKMTLDQLVCPKCEKPLAVRKPIAA